MIYLFQMRSILFLIIISSSVLSDRLSSQKNIFQDPNYSLFLSKPVYSLIKNTGKPKILRGTKQRQTKSIQTSSFQPSSQFRHLGPSSFKPTGFNQFRKSSNNQLLRHRQPFVYQNYFLKHGDTVYGYRINRTLTTKAPSQNVIGIDGLPLENSIEEDIHAQNSFSLPVKKTKTLNQILTSPIYRVSLYVSFISYLSKNSKIFENYKFSQYFSGNDTKLLQSICQRFFPIENYNSPKILFQL